MRRVFEMIILLAIFAAGIFFAFINRDNHTTVGVWWEKEYTVPVVVVVAAAFGVGVLLTMLLAGVEIMKRNMQLRGASRRIRTLEAERDELRNLPLKEELRAAPDDVESAALPPDSTL